MGRRGTGARRFWPRAATRRRWLRRLRRTPAPARVLLYALCAAIIALTVNFAYQVARKPTELFFPVSGVLFKTPEQTWRVYSADFRRDATRLIRPELLAALAQVEASGNPLVRTYWRWSIGLRPFEVYRPASSAVGMYQMTDATFAEARHYCIHEHERASEGAWDDWHGCWFNRLYLRVLPADAIELTAAYLDLKVGAILARRQHLASAREVQHLAAVVHLCGAGAAEAYAQRGLRFSAGERCGDHDPRLYLARVDEYARQFARLAEREDAASQ
jgi:hypothetical protein